jgi:molybdopterin-synthase adenylyltransferase
MKPSDQGPFSRQSFLGPHSQEYIEQCVVGIAGLGGGGSHIVQQLAHLGFLKFVLFDPDGIEESNLNRLVGATARDVVDKTLKIDIARRMILSIRPQAEVLAFSEPWQARPEFLRRCDLVFGCVDGLDQRRQLEATTRRYLIPLIDIGMDVYEGTPPSVSGQVILSMPGHPCMSCMSFLNDDDLTREAEAYGAAGSRPQVVWPNGFLASAAVGIAVDLVTDWSQSLRGPVYLSYRGNLGMLTQDPFLQHAPKHCSHFDVANVGPPRFRPM